MNSEKLEVSSEYFCLATKRIIFRSFRQPEKKLEVLSKSVRPKGLT